MGLGQTLSVLKEVPTVLKIRKHMTPRDPSTRDCYARLAEHNARQWADKTAIIFEGRTINWQDLNAIANRYAHELQAQGVTAGDCISLFMENRIEFIALFIALNKVGAIAGLINTNLTGQALVHCINVTQSRKIIVGEELIQSISDVRRDTNLREGSDYLFVPDQGQTPAPAWASNLDSLAAGANSNNLAVTADHTLRMTGLYLFTSGTTGLPKAANISIGRYLRSAKLAYLGGLRCSERDCIYLCLPLYHGTGLMLGVGVALHSGASMFIRRRFSASQFLSEVRQYGATCLIYVGELCRYLLSCAEQPDDADNPLRAMLGNGLRPDVWKKFKTRFAIKRIVEFYGSSEGNVGFFNLLNRDNTVGFTTSQIALVRYDVDADEIVRDARDRCIPVGNQEPGLLLSKIDETAVFEGYTDADATEKKILRNAFEPGDAWFNTGDLLKEVDVGFALGYTHYQFVDRVGDTYRWKSENVSTNEVGELIASHPDVEICNVYGVEVPGCDGRAGMAAIALKQGIGQLNLESLSQHICKELAAYARPVFLRLQPEMAVTGTFKMVKGELRKQGFDPSLCQEPLFVLKPGSTTYEPLDDAFYQLIRQGQAGY